MIWKDTEYLVTPIGTVDGGFAENAAVIGEEFKAQPETLTQKANKTAENLAYGETRRKDQVPFGGITVFGNHADKVNTDYMPRRGTPIQLDSRSHFADKAITIMAFLKQLRAEIAITPDINRMIREHYGKSITLAEKDRILTEVRNGAAIDQAIGGNNVAIAANAY